MNRDNAANALLVLMNALDSYYPLSRETWSKLAALCEFRRFEKQTVLYQCGEIPLTFAFVYSGLLRVYVIDENGNEYNKNFFDEGKFPGSMTALLTSRPSLFAMFSSHFGWFGLPVTPINGLKSWV